MGSRLINSNKKTKVLFGGLILTVIAFGGLQTYFYFTENAVNEAPEFDAEVYKDKIIYEKYAKTETIIKPFEEDTKKKKTTNDNEFIFYIKSKTADDKTLGIIEINPPEGLEIDKNIEKQIKRIKEQKENGIDLPDYLALIVYYREESTVTKDTFLKYSSLVPYLKDLNDLGIDIFLMKESSKSPKLNKLRFRTIFQDYLIDSKTIKMDEATISITELPGDITPIIGNVVD